MVFNNKDTPHSITLDRVGNLTKDYKFYNSKIYGVVKTRQTSSLKIRTPSPTGIVKLNCDASLSNEGWVVVGRNDQGDVLFAATRRVRAYWPPLVAEGKAVLMAIRLARRFGLRDVIIEGDC